MLDVHILVMDYTPAAWLAQCLDSVDVAAQRAEFAVNVHVLPGILGHLGQARAAGYARGTGTHVTHVDDDDFVHPEAFYAMRELLEADVEAVTTGETQLYTDSGKSADLLDSRHHLAVYRRDQLERSDYAEFRYHPDQRLLSQVDPVHLPRCLYTCRVYNGSGSRLQRRTDPAGAAAEMERIRNPALFMAEAHTPDQIARMLELP